MSLVIEDFRSKYRVDNIGELQAVLTKRYEAEVNGFWLSREDERFPVMSVLVKGNLATLLYVPKKGHPGFASEGGVADLGNEGFTTFRVDAVEQELVVANNQVVPLANALSAARDFFVSRDLPSSMTWTEL